MLLDNIFKDNTNDEVTDDEKYYIESVKNFIMNFSENENQIIGNFARLTGILRDVNDKYFDIFINIMKDIDFFNLILSKAALFKRCEYHVYLLNLFSLISVILYRDDNDTSIIIELFFHIIRAEINNIVDVELISIFLKCICNANPVLDISFFDNIDIIRIGKNFLDEPHDGSIYLFYVKYFYFPNPSVTFLDLLSDLFATIIEERDIFTNRYKELLSLIYHISKDSVHFCRVIFENLQINKCFLLVFENVISLDCKRTLLYFINFIYEYYKEISVPDTDMKQVLFVVEECCNVHEKLNYILDLFLSILERFKSSVSLECLLVLMCFIEIYPECIYEDKMLQLFETVLSFEDNYSLSICRFELVSRILLLDGSIKYLQILSKYPPKYVDLLANASYGLIGLDIIISSYNLYKSTSNHEAYIRSLTENTDLVNLLCELIDNSSDDEYTGKASIVMSYINTLF